MRTYNLSEIIVSGPGVTSAIGQSKAAFISALLQGRENFGVMQRPGRQYSLAATGTKECPAQTSAFWFSRLPHRSRHRA